MNTTSCWTNHTELNDAIATMRSEDDYKDYQAAAKRIVDGCAPHTVKIAARLYIENALRDLDRAGAREIERMMHHAAKVEERVRKNVERYHSRENHETAAQRRSREKRESQRRKTEEMIRAAMDEVARAFEALEWQEELLASRFVLNDGTMVSWGEATEDQHQERIDMFLANAASNTEGAARHQKAINDLRAHGVRTLRQIPNASADAA
ncbi:hypothetical protein ICV35_23740 [Rhodococcus ruber]|uniref:hypothetical protein n=1 Tax=Rhodococcus ruber TaxID=1830 RepID=UPI0017838926|nr:hypothetical protein [Rhodococcus ruber]MBD8056666.1 hypothetical protein [Rhodococcus ruber]